MRVRILAFCWILRLEWNVLIVVGASQESSHTNGASDDSLNAASASGREVATQQARDGQLKDQRSHSLWADLLRKFVWIPRLPGEVYRRALSAYGQLEFSTAVATLLAQSQRRTARSTRAFGDAKNQLEEYCESTDAEPHIGMVLTNTGSKLHDDAYELTQPVHLQLGSSVEHAVDFAFTPVLSSDMVESEHMLEEATGPDAWWQWWLHWWTWRHDDETDPFARYRMSDTAFAGGSHGEVWRGRRRCTHRKRQNEAICHESLVLKRLKIEQGYRILEAGLREVHFGQWLASQEEGKMFTRYLDHFFREQAKGGLELWIVFADAGQSLRSFLYTGVLVGDLIVYQHSSFWTKMRYSVARRKQDDTDTALEAFHGAHAKQTASNDMDTSTLGRQLMGSVLRQILEAASFLHQNGICHRDIKPSNVMCTANFTIDDLTGNISPPLSQNSTLGVLCVLGDFSSAWSDYTDRHLYTRGPSRLEQTDEYAPPEAIFGHTYSRRSRPALDAAFDSWSIGILALELLLGTPNVFSVDQRTRAVLTHKMRKEGSSQKEIDRALYLAALSQFCIYSPSRDSRQEWPLRHGNPLFNYTMVKRDCTLHDFYRALHMRDPLGLGFDGINSDALLHLIWQLLQWDPKARMTATQALLHPYFTRIDLVPTSLSTDETALESQMLDPRMDFNLSDSVSEFRCPQCNRTFADWNSCRQHAQSRRHGTFCRYERSSLPTCLSAHSMLPAHPSSGYCDIQGRRRVIEDFHAIQIHPHQQFYGIFDGHTGNLCSKFVASFLYDKLDSKLATLLHGPELPSDWKDHAKAKVSEAFDEIHHDFLEINSLVSHSTMDQSGTTATAVLVTSKVVVVGSLGDSRAVLSSRDTSSGLLSAIQLTTDHVASDPLEQQLVQERGGRIVYHNGMHRVNGQLAITRSIGDAKLSSFLSRTPQVLAHTVDEIKELCGYSENQPCFLIVASDGLWDRVENQEAVDMVAEVVAAADEESTGLQEAAESLTLEAYVRGSRDNIGTLVIALD